MVWYSHLLKNFPQFTVVHIVKNFDIHNKTEVDVSLEISWFFDDQYLSGSSAFPKSSLSIWKFSVHVLLKPSLENFDSLKF